MDGTSRKIGVVVGLQLKALNRGENGAGYTVRLPMSNNEAEYEAILTDIDLAISASS